MNFKERIPTSEEGLTDVQAKEQNLIDNAIYDLIVNINPGETIDIDWNAKVIADVREALWQYYEPLVDVTEFEFYPYMEDPADPTSKFGVAHVKKFYANT